MPWRWSPCYDSPRHRLVQRTKVKIATIFFEVVDMHEIYTVHPLQTEWKYFHALGSLVLATCLYFGYLARKRVLTAVGLAVSSLP